MSLRNASASAGSSAAISSSIFAHSGDRARAFAREERLHAGRFGGALDARGGFGIRFVEVDHDEQRLGREQLKAAQAAEVLAGKAERAQRLAVLERGLALEQQVLFLVELGATCSS